MYHKDAKLFSAFSQENFLRSLLAIQQWYGSMKKCFFAFAIYPTVGVISDFNGDDLLDILVGHYYNGTISILLAIGNGSFIPAKVFFIDLLSDGKSFAVGYFNNDNRSDVVATGTNTRGISVRLGYDSGSFDNPITYATSTASHPSSIITKDINHDYFLDLIITNHGTDSINVFFGYGHGSFALAQTYFIGVDSSPQSVVAGDFNQDNKVDIANSIDILFENATGTLIKKTTLSVASGAGLSSLAIGDFNNDNKSDMAVLNTSDGHIAIVLLSGAGNGSLTMAAVYPTGFDSYLTSIAVGDFNHDNKWDIAVTDMGSNSIIILLGLDKGLFGNETRYSIDMRSVPSSVTMADLNNDNKLDIVVINVGAKNIAIFLGNDDGTFLDYTSYRVDYIRGTFSIGMGDFNRDDNIYIVITYDSRKEIGVFYGDGSGTFTGQMTYSTGSNSQPESVAVGDFNEDGCLDIVVLDIGEVTVRIFLGDGNGTFANYTTYFQDIFRSLDWMKVGDFNNDGRLDILLIMKVPMYIIVALGYGDGTFNIPLAESVKVADFPEYLAIGDFNNDHYLDIVLDFSYSKVISVILASCCDPFRSSMTFSTGAGSQSHSIAVDDFNMDHQLDSVVANEGMNTIGIFLSYGNRTFTNPTISQTGPGFRPYSVFVADLNNDNYLDIIVANYANETICLFRGDGNGTFHYDKSYWTGLGSRPYSVVTGDFDNDTYLDIGVSNDGTNNVGILFGSENGYFLKVMTFNTGYNSQPHSRAVSDFNSDSQMDIAVALAETNSIGIISKRC